MLSRQQIYDRIRMLASKEEYIRREMVRLGYWPKDKAVHDLPPEFFKRRGELEQELSKLLQNEKLTMTPEALLKELRQKRMVEAFKKREQNKIDRAKASHEKALAWHRRRKTDILHLGTGVSAGLNHRESDVSRLQRHQLPQIHTAAQLAEHMGIALEELRFLSFTRQTSPINHYRRFFIPKKTGGHRLISSPMPRIKRAQYWILDNILNPVPVSDQAHGFCKSRSIVSNAAGHVGRAVVINMDLENFFPTIDYPRIKGLFVNLGYSQQVATIFALLCSEPDMDLVELDGVNYHVADGDRHLPQGAPTSPAITNLICRRLDKRLQGLAAKYDYHYTRYADDLTFSAACRDIAVVSKILAFAKRIVKEEGFVVHPDKTRVMHRGRRQEVTGLTVNDSCAVERKTLRRFRALVYQLEKDGTDNKHWGRTVNILSAAAGYANFIAMVDAAKGMPFVNRIAKLRRGKPPENTKPGLLNKILFRKNAAAGREPRQPWWQPAIAPEPSLALPPPAKKPPTQRNIERQQQQQQKRKQQADKAEKADRLETALTKIFEFIIGLVLLAILVFLIWVVFRAFLINPVVGIAVALGIFWTIRKVLRS